MEFLGPILAKLHSMPPTSAPAAVAGPAVRDRPSRRASRWGKNVQWNMKAWFRKPRRGDLPMCDFLCRIQLHMDSVHLVITTQPYSIILMTHGLYYRLVLCGTISYNGKCKVSKNWSLLDKFRSTLRTVQWQCTILWVPDSKTHVISKGWQSDSWLGIAGRFCYLSYARK